MKKKTIYLVILLLNIIFIGTANASTLTGSWAGPVVDSIKNAEIRDVADTLGFDRWIITTSSASGIAPVEVKVYPTGLYSPKHRPTKIFNNTNMIRFQAYAGFNANTNETTIGVSTGLNAYIRLTSNDQIVCYPYTSGSMTSFECPIAKSMQGKEVAFILFQFAPATLGAYQFGVSDVFQLFNETSQAQQDANNKLDDIKNSEKETNNKLDDIKNSDISNDSKESPNTSEYNDYQNAENGLFEKMEQADTSNLDVAIDGNSANFVWNTITRFYNSYALLMNFLISILSIGIIKMALGR